MALSSSSGPKGVGMRERVMPSGRDVSGGTVGSQDSVQRLEEGSFGAGIAYGGVMNREREGE